MVTSGLLFSLITAVCPVGVDVPNKQQCLYRYEVGGLSAQECSEEKGALIGAYWAKGITNLRLAECWEEQGVPLDQLTGDETELN